MFSDDCFWELVVQKSCVHLLRMVVYLIFYRGFSTIPDGFLAGFLNHQQEQNISLAVDGRNPAPVEVGSLSRYLQGSIYLRWLAGFLPSVLSTVEGPFIISSSFKTSFSWGGPCPSIGTGCPSANSMGGCKSKVFLARILKGTRQHFWRVLDNMNIFIHVVLFFAFVWVFPKIKVPQNGWFIMDFPLLKLMIWGENPLFLETSIYIKITFDYVDARIPHRRFLMYVYTNLWPPCRVHQFTIWTRVAGRKAQDVLMTQIEKPQESYGINGFLEGNQRNSLTLPPFFRRTKMNWIFC